MTLTVLTRPCTCAREEVGREVVSGDSGLHNPPARLGSEIYFP